MGAREKFNQPDTRWGMSAHGSELVDVRFSLAPTLATKTTLEVDPPDRVGAFNIFSVANMRPRQSVPWTTFEPWAPISQQRLSG